MDPKRYEAVATVLELRGLTSGTRRLEKLLKNKLVAEYIALKAEVANLKADLDAKLKAMSVTPTTLEAPDGDGDTGAAV